MHSERWNRNQRENFCSRFPFEWKTPFGYFVAILMETVAMFWGNMILVPTGCFLIGSCWFVMAFIDDIINDLITLDNYGKWRGNLAWKLRQQFYFIAQNIADAKQLSIMLELKNKWIYNESELFHPTQINGSSQLSVSICYHLSVVMGTLYDRRFTVFATQTICWVL